ncbi:RNA-binding protein [Deltaproteobacteria bacterium OttesenSCG-928-M10]|nr:RNA-binding protein [Deltaproteobacteria bacterium OttesenSCG-928-M10]
MTVSIYVGNLPFSTDQNALQDLFAPFGEVLSANVISDRETGRSRGFGFVEMEADAARQAITALDGQEHAGRRLKVNEAQKRESRDSRPRRF